MSLSLGALLLRERARSAFSFRNKVVVITGGSRGLGFILARELGREGANLVLCARTERDLREAADRLARDSGAIVLTKVCDVTNRAQVRELIDFAVDAFGRIDVVINNAGIIQVGPFESMGEDDYRNAMNSIFWGTLHTTLEALPYLEPGARLMNIASIGGMVPVPHLIPYVAAKYAVVGFSETLAAELARHRISVTSAVPGLMRTGSFIHALFKGRQDTEMSLFSVLGNLPLVSMNAERAARRMIEACRSRKPVVVVGAPAKMARLAHALFPNFVIKLLSLVSRALPLPPLEPAERTRAEPGWLHRRGLARSPLTRLGDRAAEKFNEA